MSIHKKTAFAFSIPPMLCDQWDITEWYRITQKHYIFKAINKKTSTEKVFEIIHDKYFSKKLWNTLSHLSNPSLLLPENITTWKGTHILEFPYYRSLKQLVLRNGISLNLIFQLMIDILISLNTLHQANILHMDISTDNIFYTEEGHFILGDFSESCFLTSAPFPIVNQTHPILAPECITDSPTILSEQYNLGILFYILCNEGNYPPKDFHGRIPQDLTIFQWMPEISESLQFILSKMLASNPSDRYPDLSFLHQDIENLISQLPEQTSYYLKITDESHPFHQTITRPNISFVPNKKYISKISILFLVLIITIGFRGFTLLRSSVDIQPSFPNKSISESVTHKQYSNNTTIASQTSLLEPIGDSSSILDIGNGKYTSLTTAFPEHLIFTDIQVLLAENNNFTDLEEISALSNLQEIYLSGNQINNTDAFSSLSKLEILILSDNNCTDLSGLTELQQLYFLDLSGNHDLINISVLSNLTKLQTLILSDTSVTESSIRELQTALPQCEIIY